MRVCNAKIVRPRASTVETQPQLQPDSRTIPLPKCRIIRHNSHMQVERLWCFQDNERFPRFVIIDSKKIDGAAFDRANKILEESGATDDFTPIIFLDEKLDSPELRAQIQG